MGEKGSDLPSHKFSLVRGGLVYLLERRAGLTAKDPLGLRKRIILFWCMTWLPIAILELFRAAGAGTFHISHPLLASGLGINIRLLVSGGILLASESLVETRVTEVIFQFEKRGIVATADDLAIILAAARRQISGRPGVMAELMILALLLLGNFLGIDRRAAEAWELLAPGSPLPAGMVWYLRVSLPLLFFLLLRWAWRFSAWLRVLWKMSRLELRLSASHPDLAGGLAFISLAQQAFAPIMLAISASAAASVAFRVKTVGLPLQSFFAPIGCLVVIETLVLVAPLLFFFRRLFVAKYAGMFRYGALASAYVNDFDRKWKQGVRSVQEPLLGSPDMEPWANIGTGLERAQKMKPFPGSLSAMLPILLAGALPFLPLAFLAVPADEILRAVLKLLF